MARKLLEDCPGGLRKKMLKTAPAGWYELHPVAICSRIGKPVLIPAAHFEFGSLQISFARPFSFPPTCKTAPPCGLASLVFGPPPARPRDKSVL